METARRTNHDKARKIRGRILAALLGLSLPAVPIGGWLYWNQSYIEGVEACSVCGMQRDVDRRGPFWFRSEPYAGSIGLDFPDVACSDHHWVKTGCWLEDGGASYHPIVRR